MRKMILASHGSLAEGMKTAAVMILGESCEMRAFGLDTYETPENIRGEVCKDLEKYQEDEFLILCDIKGGSVHNALLELCDRDNVCLVTGMNLGLVLELYLMPEDCELAKEVKSVIEVSREGIQYFSKQTIESECEGKGDSLW